jgi:hypothetical protein
MMRTFFRAAALIAGGLLAAPAQAQIGFQVWPSKTPDEFGQYVADQLAHWRALIKQAGIQPE